MFNMNIFECRAECRTCSSIFKLCMILNAELNADSTARYSRLLVSNAELKSIPLLDIQSVYAGECRAEYRSCSSKFKTIIFECRAECRSYSWLLKVCLVFDIQDKCF